MLELEAINIPSNIKQLKSSLRQKKVEYGKV